MIYDAAGRLGRNDVSNGAYIRFVYPNASSTGQGMISFTLLQTGGAEFYSEQVFDGAGRVISAASDFPGSTGRYRGQYTTYDLMGRQASVSNPTEITNQWVPAGDDAEIGWKYANQAYDWKGRPTITTNTDSTTTELTYGGCGCAGGEVVTARDEINHRQRVTHDVLGRPVKTEVLNFDQSVYATRTDTYNVRDQVTRIFVQQGTNGTGQETLMTYDGHGRLQTRKTPIQGSPTSYTYYSDDTVQRVTDPRGANSNFIYNGRHLATGITYLKQPGSEPEPEGISPAPAVSFSYDSAGNRGSMTDGLGSVSYQYDTWSRLTSETRTFTGLPGTSALSYEYNLAGRLKKLTDPFGTAINYFYNDAGQLTSVTGSGFPGVSQFASSTEYRAWGGVKRCSYGNNANLDIGYNTRMLMTHFGLGASGSDFEYYDDARVKFASNFLNNAFDRKYTYDHVGRLTQALTGSEARADSSALGPYKQVYQYDSFDNLTSRTNRFWSQPDDGYTATYVNDRNTAWNYDSAGNIKDDTMSHTYDVLSRQTNAHDFSTSIDQSYDGDSRPAKRLENRSGYESAIYYVRSSVLGGQVVTELNTAGQNNHTHKTHVYVNGSEIALYDSWFNLVLLRLSNPVTGSGWQETDPLGGLIGFVTRSLQIRTRLTRV